MMLTPLSQCLDFKEDEYKTKGCGITCLGMFIGDDFNLDDLFKKGVDSGAYIPGIGWRHAGLAELARQFGFTRSQNYDLASFPEAKALKVLESALVEGPVIASVHARYDVSQTEGHLVVLLALTGEEAEVMDPAAENREGVHQRLPRDRFLSGWKKRLITIRT